MFDASRSAEEARRADKLESIYHRGQDLAWNGREVLDALMKKHGGVHMDERHRDALGRIFSIIMWGELAAWRVSAQLADHLVPLEAKMAATSQAHDEARHFYVLHDYLKALGYEPGPPDKYTQAVLGSVLKTDWLPAKLLGMQLLIENLALTIFHFVRKVNADPVLSELLAYYEKDEARHVGLGVQELPNWLRHLRPHERVRLLYFQLGIIANTLRGLHLLEPDFAILGISAREVLTLGMAKQEQSSMELFQNLRIKTTVTREVLRKGVNVATELWFAGEDRPLFERMRAVARVLRTPVDVGTAAA
jgi:hypothetical protein